MQLLPRYFLLALALSVSAAPALAQGKSMVLPPAPPLALSGLRGEQFVLGPDDVIAVTVIGVPELSSNALTLSSTGRVTLPLIGVLTIRGKTLEQARRAIEVAYKSQLRNPKVAISLVRAQPRRATVLGAVARPGAVDLQLGWRVSEVLASAGGLGGAAPDEVTATLKRSSGATIALDIAAIYRALQSKANLRVEVGDVISVALIPRVNVTINGDVGAPGAQIFRKAPRLLDALKRAGDLKLAPADSDISLLRDGKIIALDVAAATGNPAGAANLELRDGDLLSVQGVRLSISVLSDEGLVKTSGNFQFDGRSNFYRAIIAAGGLTAAPGQISATVRRGNSVIPVDLARAIYDRNADIALQNNDIIVLKPADAMRVRLVGEVKTPAQYGFQKGAKVSDALLQAGGLSGAPAATRITVWRTLPGGRQIPFQIDAALLSGGNNASQNLELKDGDVVLVNALATPFVAVLGEVEKPGTYDLGPQNGLAQALRNAGGAGELADLSRVTINRKGQASRVVDGSQLNKSQVLDFKLEDGDNVRVPTNPRQILLMDALQKPGLYAIAQGATLTLGEAISRAGGTLPGARTSDITLLRRSPQTPQTPQGYTATRVNSGDAGNGNSGAALSLPLQPGDVVLVPPGKDGPFMLAQGIQALNAFDVARGFEF